MGSDLVYSILSPEWNADKTRVDKVRYWTAVARLFLESCAGRSHGGGRIWRRLDLVMRIPVANILTLDALQVLFRSQVCPLSCQCPCGYGRYVKVYITYLSMTQCLSSHTVPTWHSPSYGAIW
jgi:hypothetical protein